MEIDQAIEEIARLTERLKRLTLEDSGEGRTRKQLYDALVELWVETSRLEHRCYLIVHSSKSPAGPTHPRCPHCGKPLKISLA
jgi:hypothetical protein